jgi:hypothetical protein
MAGADEPLLTPDDVDDAEGAWYVALRQLLQRWV